MPDEQGRKVFKVMPPGDGNSIQDVLDELYSVLYRRGYAIAQGRYGAQSVVVLCEVREEGRRLIPVAQIAQMIPDYGQRAAKGIDWRKVGSDKPEPVTQ